MSTVHSVVVSLVPAVFVLVGAVIGHYVTRLNGKDQTRSEVDKALIQERTTENTNAINGLRSTVEMSLKVAEYATQAADSANEQLVSVNEQLASVNEARATQEQRLHDMEARLSTVHHDAISHISVLEEHINARKPPPPPSRPAGLQGKDTL